MRTWEDYKNHVKSISEKDRKNMENIEKYLEMTKDYPNLGLGVHLNITVGKPLTNVSFVDEKGKVR